MYRADTGNWVKIESLEEADNMPLSEEFDDYFITALTFRLAPRYGLPVAGETAAALMRARSRIRARYRCRRTYYEPDYGLVDYRDQYGYYGYFGDEFDRGHLHRW